MKKILIVDDQPTIRRLVEISLQTVDRLILEAESGEDAIEVARAETPDLIIMDLMMPGGMDGFQAIERIKENPQTSDCPVLVLTAKDQRLERLRAFEVGANDYLAKPFKLDVLLKKVETLLDGHHELA
ncbi:MAG: response regulator [Desulfuromonadales bacterium]